MNSVTFKSQQSSQNKSDTFWHYGCPQLFRAIRVHLSKTFAGPFNWQMPLQSPQRCHKQANNGTVWKINSIQLSTLQYSQWQHDVFCQHALPKSCLHNPRGTLPSPLTLQLYSTWWIRVEAKQYDREIHDFRRKCLLPGCSPRWVYEAPVGSYPPSQSPALTLQPTTNRDSY